MPAPYTFTFDEPANFQWTDTAGAQHQETGKQGDQLVQRVVDNACDALRFLNAAKASGERVAGDARTQAAIDEVARECGATPGGSSTVTPPPEPPPQSDPSTTGTDAPPAGGEETPQTLNAPDAGPGQQARVERDPPPPGTSDGRPLSQQVYNPEHPLQQADLPGVLLQSVPPGDIDDAIQSVFHNDAPPGQRHPQFGRDDHEPPDAVADPVLLFPGAFAITATDVRIPSRGFPLELVRTYRSGAVRFGPWGYNWDHSYNVYLRELDDGGAAIWTGALSEDVYALNADGTFEPPLGLFKRLVREAATPLTPPRWVLTDRDGLRQIFDRPAGWPHADRIPLASVEDRHGNSHVVDYDTEGRVRRVSDHAARYIEFGYGDCGLLEEVRDHAGRAWRYLHDAEVEHLETFMSPATPEHPDGLSTGYEYDRFQSHPALRHNITRVIDPAGRQLVENHYGDDPVSDDFGRVVRQEYGGFEILYAATGIQYVPRTPDAINVPARRVEVLECGSLQVYTFNYRGDVLDHRYRLVRDGSFRLVARISRYDEQGNRIEVREPNGLGVISVFDTVNPDPRGRGNVLRITLSAPPTRPAPSRDIVRLTYEPRYQRIKRSRDERGAETTYVYDYEVSPRDNGDVVRIEHPDVTLPDASVQTGAETFTYNATGQVTERVSPEGHRFTFDYYATGPAAGYLERTTAGPGVEDQTQRFAYDAYGQLSAVTTASGARTEWERNALGQIVHLRKPAVGGATGDVGYRYGPDGRLQSYRTPRGGYDDGTIAEPYVLHELEHDVLGHLRSVVYGANTAQPRRWSFRRTPTGEPVRVVDPLGRVTQTDYDERRLPLRDRLFVATPNEREARLRYDRNGNLTRFTDAAGRRVDQGYDSWDRLAVVEPPGAPGARTEMRFIHGDRDELERCTTRGVSGPGGPVVVLEEWTQSFDERGRVWKRVQGAATEERWHDRDSRLVRIVDQRANMTQLACDALGRVTQVQDPAGNRQTHAYNPDGDLVQRVEDEVGPGGAPAGTFTTTFAHDARGRLARVTDPLGNVTATEYDDRDLPVAVTTPSGVRTELEHDVLGQMTLTRLNTGGLAATHAWQRDAGGRVLTYTDPESEATAYEYDPEDRWTAITTPDGLRRERSYDAAGQLSLETAPSGTQSLFSYGPDGTLARLAYSAAPGTLPVPDLVFGRDGMGRVVELTQGTDSITLAFDALGRLTSETRAGRTVTWAVDDAAGWADLTYPDGRVDRWTQDALGRMASLDLRTLATPPATGAGIAPGTTLAQYEYAGPSRVVARTLANGCVTDYRYDPGRRLVGIEHRDAAGTPLVRADYVHDADGARRFVGIDPAPGAPALVEPDRLERLTGYVEGFAAPPLPAAPTQANADAWLAALGTPGGAVEHEYTVDRADVRTRAIVQETGAATTDDYATAPAHRITALTRTTPAGSTIFPFEFDDDGRCIRDDRHGYVYDAMGRLRQVTDGAGTTLLTQEYDPAGRVSSRSAGGATQTLHHLGPRTVQAETGAAPAVLQRTLGLHPDELVLESGGADRWAHQDARLSLLAVSDAGGAVLERYSYAPFGTARIWAPDGVTARPASSVEMPPIFGGHRLIEPAGLYDARARVYDAETGRFLQRDPRGYASGANPYAYTGHDPINRMDTSGEIAPIIAAIVIFGALAGVGYSFWDASDHPERYQGPLSFRAFFNTAAGAVIGGVSALGGEAVLASVGMGSFGAAAGGATAVGAGGTLSLTQTFVLSGTVSTVGGFIWRAGFNGLFPEYEAPPSVGTMATDYAFGGVLGLGFRTLEAVGNPFSRAGWKTIRTSVDEAGVRIRMWANQAILNPQRAQQLSTTIAELRVARLHSGELQQVGQELESVAFRVPGEGQRVVFNAEVDVVVDSAWIQVKASNVAGRSGRFGLAQAEYTAYGSPTGRSIYYVEPGSGYTGVVRDLLRAGVSEVRPLVPWLRGIEPFPLPFQGMLGRPAVQVPWAELWPDPAASPK